MNSSQHISEEELIEYLDGKEVSAAFADHLKTCGTCTQKVNELQEVLASMSNSPEISAPKSIGLELDHQIELEKRQLSLSEANRGGFNYWQIAASVALLITGYLLGSQFSRTENVDVIALRNEITELKEVTMVSALQNYSASQRIQAVNQIQSAPADQSSKKLTDALLETLNTDESPNVRYAALQAITKFTADADLKESLVASLKVQEDPLIQISLIGYLVELAEKSAIAPIKNLMKDEQASPEVKHQAKIALDILI